MKDRENVDGMPRRTVDDGVGISTNERTSPAAEEFRISKRMFRNAVEGMFDMRAEIQAPNLAAAIRTIG